jgi:hypothetical protein
MRIKIKKPTKPAAGNAVKLYRDADGNVRTPAGSLSRAAYLGVIAANPDVRFPDYDRLPVRKLF